MRSRFFAIGLRLAILVVVWTLGTATLSLAQETGTSGEGTSPVDTGSTAEEPVSPAGPLPDSEAIVAEEPTALIVPDVRGLPYIFAKGVLEDAGFAWTVVGKVEGYATNLVEKQSVKPGTKVVDTGWPTVELTLQANDSYEERGLPQPESPYAGTELVLWSGGEPTPAEADTSDEDASDTGSSESMPEAAAEDDTGEDVAEETGAAGDSAETDQAEEETERPPDFVVAGAPPEPQDEISLPERAKRLEKKLAGAPEPTPFLVDHWQYQHAWIVAGAGFGWWHGAQALRILITIDEDLQQRWNMGYQSEQIARAALAEVLAAANAK